MKIIKRSKISGELMQGARLTMVFSLLSAISVGQTACRSRPATLGKNTSEELVKITPSPKAYAKARPEFLERCGSDMTQSQYAELLETSDLSTFSDYREAAPRAKLLAEIFAKAKDRRGIFASMYVEITKESVGSSFRGEYQDSKLASELVKRFADRYFGPLHNYLLNGSVDFADASLEKNPIVPEWAEYYKLADDCKASDLRILGTGVNSHMTYDLPLALVEIESPESFEADFMKFGDILIQKKRVSTDLLISQQNVYAAAFFDLFFLGKLVDGIWPDGTAATVGFQYVRAGSWSSAMKMIEGFKDKRTPTNALPTGLGGLEINDRWSARQTVLMAMPQSNSKMKGTEE